MAPKSRRVDRDTIVSDQLHLRKHENKVYTNKKIRIVDTVFALENVKGFS